jgi:thiamine kinase-like enzyme
MIILDFEYSDLNYCGMDLASYINESTIKYCKDYPYYEYYPERMPNFLLAEKETIDQIE